MNIAIFSPNRNAYSETFIQAHKRELAGTIKYYYAGKTPTKLEGKGKLYNSASRWRYALYRKIGRTSFNNKQLALQESLKREKIDVVLAEYGNTAADALPVIKALKISLIVHFHGYDAHKKEITEQFANAYIDVFKYARFVVAVSQHMKRALITLGCPEEKVVLATYGPNELFLKTNRTPKEKQFIAVGRFVDKKAPYFTIIAFKNLLQKHPDAKLYMVGDGLLWNTCKNLIDHWQLNKNIILTNILPPEEIARLFSESFAFIQHSVVAESGDSEGTPVAILEASGAGLPVVATRHAGIPDVIVDGETGILIDEKDVQAMTKAMIQLLENPSLAEQMGQNGKKRIQEHFTMAHHINILNNLIKESLSK
jgi:colanic acid/amylovoran biosynthesis glycosyltransferase